MREVKFHVPGKPQGKARAKTFYTNGVTRTVTPEKTVLYENFIKDRYLQEAGGFFLETGTPVELRIVARFLPPTSASKIVKHQMLSGKILPLKKPDVDNIVKVVADSLNGIAYHDDKQIAFAAAKKAYSAVEGLDITVGEYKGEG